MLYVLKYLCKKRENLAKIKLFLTNLTFIEKILSEINYNLL